MTQVRTLIPGDEDLLAKALRTFGCHAEHAIDPKAHLADESLVSLVALGPEGVIGFLYGYVLRRFGKTSFLIYSVEVIGASRCQGIAGDMLAHLSSEARRRGWNEMFVLTNSANEAAMALYRSAGGVRPNEDDVLFDFYPAQT
jgi:ribosomal protein S18 acetylase RimI-like enzyme